jgi:hypothetical protein
MLSYAPSCNQQGWIVAVGSKLSIEGVGESGGLRSRKAYDKEQSAGSRKQKAAWLGSRVLFGECSVLCFMLSGRGNPTGRGIQRRVLDFLGSPASRGVVTDRMS